MTLSKSLNFKDLIPTAVEKSASLLCVCVLCVSQTKNLTKKTCSVIIC